MIRAITIVLLVSSTAASAQPVSAQAEALFRQARELMAAGKLAEACSAFQESQKLDPAVTTLSNLAACREKLGELATAWGLFVDVARQTRSARDAASKRLHKVAQGRAQKLEPRISKLTIRVPPPNRLEGLEITRGTERIAAGMWNRALPIDGGTYQLTARAPGAGTWSTQVTVAAERDAQTVEIPDLRTLPREPDPPVVQPPAGQPPAGEPSPRTQALPLTGSPPTDSRPESTRPSAPPGSSSNALPLAVGVGALALLGGGVGVELWARSTYDKAKSETMNQSRRNDLYDSANTRRHIAQALAVSGVAAGGVAVWLYVRGRGTERDATRRASVHLVPAPAGLALAGQF